MARLFSTDEDNPRPDEKSWITISKAKRLETGSQDFTRLDATESKAFKREPKSQFTIETVKCAAVRAAVELANTECYAGRLSWHKTKRLEWLLKHLNRNGWWINEATIRHYAGIGL